jgi:large subunit ribosomal protein L25
MAQAIELRAEVRTATGKGANRRLRRLEGKVPGVIYGGGGEPVSLTFAYFELANATAQESFYSQILTLDIAGNREQAIVRDMQRHPASERVTHIDFLRVRADQALTVSIPIHFLNEDRCVGVRLGGGSLSRNLTEVEVECLPKDLPQYIEVDVTDLAVGDSIHLSGLALPEGVTIPSLSHGSDYDLQVVSVNAARGEGDKA